MTTTTLEAELSAQPPAAENREHVILTNITWETYRRLRQECDRLHLKMTFDRGTLEIMAPRPDHAIITRFIDQIIVVVCEELAIPLAGYRDATWHQQAIDRGLEADDCYYIQHAAIADERGTAIDLVRDPPPDLAIETDITHSSIDKEAVYAALGVPELWRWEEGHLRIRLRTPAGRYEDAATSRALPTLPPTIVESYVHRRLREGETRAKAAFRQWVRENLSKVEGDRQPANDNGGSMP